MLTLSVARITSRAILPGHCPVLTPHTPETHLDQIERHITLLSAAMPGHLFRATIHEPGQPHPYHLYASHGELHEWFGCAADGDAYYLLTMETPAASQLAGFARKARTVGQRFGLDVTVDYDPSHDGGPFRCYYNGHPAPADYTPEEAVENLETALYFAIQSHELLFTSN